MPIKIPTTAWRVAARISLGYALLASVWIYASDAALARLAGCPSALFQTYKGWLFVAVTAALLYGLVGNALTPKRTSPLAAVSLDNAAGSGRPPPFWQGVRVPLLIFSVLASVIGGLGYLVYVHQQSALQAAKATELLTITDNKIAEIDHWLSERRTDVEFIARDPILAVTIGQWLGAGPVSEENNRRLTAWLTNLKQTFGYSAVLLTDTQGQVRLGVGASELHPLRQALVRQALASAQVVMSDLHWRQETVGGPIDLDLIAPLGHGLNPQDRPIGALVLKIDPEQYLFPLLHAWPISSPSAETLLVRREQDAVLYLSQLRHRQDTALQLRLPLTSEHLPAALVVQGRSGVLEGIDYRQVPVLAAARPVPDTPWFLIAKVDAEEVYAPLRALMLQMALVASLFIGAAGVGTALWWRQQHARFLAEGYRRELERQALVQHIDYLTRYANDIVLLTDNQGHIIEANERAVSAYGYPYQALLALTIRDLLAPEAQAQAAEETAKAVRSDGRVFETLHQRQDGSRFSVEVSSRQFEIQGQPLLQSIIRDITERKRYEEQLAEAERFARATLDALSAHVCVIDETGTILRVNQAWREFADVNEADPDTVSEGVNYLKVCAAARGPFSEGAVFFTEGIRAVLRGGCREFSMEYPAHSATEKRWFLAKVTAFQAPTPVRMVIAHENITALKQAEARLAEQRDLLENILGQAADAIVACDTQGRLTLVNATARRLALSDPDGCTLDDIPLTWGVGHYPNADPVPQQEWALVKALQGKTTMAAEARIVRPDGSCYDVLISAAPLRNAHQDIIGAVATFSDITKRKQAENALRESEARLRAMINAVPDVLLVLDEDGRYIEILTAQPQRLYTSPESLKGKRVSEVLPAELAERVLNSIHQTLLTHRTQSLEYELQIAKMGKRYFEARIAPIEVPIMDKPAVAALARDVTQRRITEENLRQAQKMEAVGQLTGGIAHDFNNLLAIILGNLDLLAEELKQPALQDLARRCLEAAERGTLLVQRLLAFARRQPLQAKAVDLNRLVSTVVDLLRRTLGETIQVETVLADDLAQVVIDPSQFETALLNLALNARDAMPGGGRLTIETAHVRLSEDDVAVHRYIKPGRYVLLAVSDTGSGMTPEVLEHAFEPFFTTKEVGKGSGLGLSMVYGLVKQSGGYIQLDSEVSRGTTVKILLPPGSAQTATVEAPSNQAPLQTGQGQMILVVEDDAQVRRLAVSMLKSLDYQTVEAETAAAALQRLEATPQVALLFTDVVLPGGMNGLELALAARQQRPELKVLFTSGYTDYHLASFSGLPESAEWLSKPYRKSQLAVKLHAMLDAGPTP